MLDLSLWTKETERAGCTRLPCGHFFATIQEHERFARQHLQAMDKLTPQCLQQWREQYDNEKAIHLARRCK